jgi:hypothetical protein
MLLANAHYTEPVALYLAGRHRLPKVRVFLDFLMERFSSAPWNIAPAGPLRHEYHCFY